jgi:hypothetical protein
VATELLLAATEHQKLYKKSLINGRTGAASQSPQICFLLNQPHALE